MNLKIAVLGGDGIGPEVLAQSLKCLRAVEETFHHQFTFTEGDIGAIAMEKHGNPLPKATVDLCRASDSILFGTIGTLKYDENPSAKVRPEQGLLQLRRELELF
ncbi:MAG: isocitrate/isopropylmalate family dehydrogenase, partial [Arenibacter sp.]|nr:isocitrate/isopropylmalate family dehydrogenase [Arenibacter sp.]